MCANYVAIAGTDSLLTSFSIAQTRSDPPADVFPSGLAPMIHLASNDDRTLLQRLIDVAISRMVPSFIYRAD